MRCLAKPWTISLRICEAGAGVPAPQVAEWARHSVEVLLRVYAKCIAGQQDEAKRRIEAATRFADGE